MAPQQTYRIDGQIRAREVRVIDDTEQQAGIITLEQALAMARERDLNLVEVAPSANPPVCRIMDYGKFKYQQKKKEHKAKRKQHQIVIKEIRVRPKTDSHDIETKLKRARDFLERGDKVQVIMLFRGREMMHLDLGIQVMNQISESLSELAKVERPPVREGRRMVMLLAKR
ncbi:MAG: translation initiation factor IF-3 [Planctomycetes bacterium]|nr:translation initiation factor IF-3 [Planctomycetota bacterium]